MIGIYQRIYSHQNSHNPVDKEQLGTHQVGYSEYIHLSSIWFLLGIKDIDIYLYIYFHQHNNNPLDKVLLGIHQVEY